MAQRQHSHSRDPLALGASSWNAAAELLGRIVPLKILFRVGKIHKRYARCGIPYLDLCCLPRNAPQWRTSKPSERGDRGETLAQCFCPLHVPRLLMSAALFSLRRGAERLAFWCKISFVLQQLRDELAVLKAWNAAEFACQDRTELDAVAHRIIRMAQIILEMRKIAERN
jgi:hypothetical protein